MRKVRVYRLSVMATGLAQSSVDLRTWERFQAGDCSAQEIADSRTLQRWVRCREAGLSAENPGDPIMAVASLTEALDEFAPLLAPGAPFDAFATTVAQAGYCGLFCDHRGVVLARRISEPFDSAVTRTRLVEGAVWSERARGTNGLGTSLVEGTAVSVVGAEHYELHNHVLACYAAPIRDVRERIVAVLDASGPVGAAAGFVHASVVATAAAIEALIAAHQEALYAFMLRLSGKPHVAEDVVQEAFVRVLRNIDRFDTRFRFSTWLFTIAKRLYVNAMQKHRPAYDTDVVGAVGTRRDA